MAAVISADANHNNQSRVHPGLVNPGASGEIGNPFLPYSIPAVVPYVCEPLHQEPKSNRTTVTIPYSSSSVADTMEFELMTGADLITGPLILNMRANDGVAGSAFGVTDAMVDNVGYHMIDMVTLVNHANKEVWRAYGWELLEYLKDYEPAIRDPLMHAAGGGFGQNETTDLVVRQEFWEGRLTGGGSRQSPRLKVALFLPFARPGSELRQALVLSSREGALTLRVRFNPYSNWVQSHIAAQNIILDQFYLSFNGIWLDRAHRQRMMDRAASSEGYAVYGTIGQVQIKDTTTSDDLAAVWRMKLDNITRPVSELIVMARYRDQLTFANTYKKLENFIPALKASLWDKNSTQLTEWNYCYPQASYTTRFYDEYANSVIHSRPYSRHVHRDPSECLFRIVFAHPSQTKHRDFRPTNLRNLDVLKSELHIWWPSTAMTATSDVDLWTFDSGLSGTEIIQVQVLGVSPWVMYYRNGTVDVVGNLP